jgi:hypothetical protein
VGDVAEVIAKVVDPGGLEKAALPDEAFNQAAGVSLGGEGGAVGFMDGVAALGGIPDSLLLISLGEASAGLRGLSVG